MKVDKINADTKVSQRHLNGIKSIFGGIKNWWNGEGKKEDSAPARPTRDRTESRLHQALAKDRESSGGVHPALRVRGFYDDDVVEFGVASDDTFSSHSRREVPSDGQSSYRQTSSAQLFAHTSHTPGWNEYEQHVDKNLGKFYINALVFLFRSLQSTIAITMLILPLQFLSFYDFKRVVCLQTVRIAQHCWIHRFHFGECTDNPEQGLINFINNLNYTKLII